MLLFTKYYRLLVKYHKKHLKKTVEYSSQKLVSIAVCNVEKTIRLVFDIFLSKRLLISFFDFSV